MTIEQTASARLSHGRIDLISVGPGDIAQITVAARQALAEADIVIGYRPYLALIAELIAGKETIAKGMTEELARCRLALEYAQAGRRTALVSSGDSGVFGMAGLLYESLVEQGLTPGQAVRIEVFPGVTAATASAARVGAPLTHDYCSISLSDQLTPWAVIEQRLRAAAAADFVTVLYNPKSKRRPQHIDRARAIFLEWREPTTPVAIVRDAYRADERRVLTTLAGMPEAEIEIDMHCTVIIGNAETRMVDEIMFTPRGYHRKYALDDGQPHPGQAPGQLLGE